ncbi:MAG: PQQ-binding-like beta-propeller repeat protein [Candidatus Binatia bacterium]
MALLVLSVCALASCTTGGGGGATCRFDDPAQLAASSWPKFRHDSRNTGSVDNPNVERNTGQLEWVFPALTEDPKGPFAASPVLNGVATDPASATRVYIGSTDGRLYAVRVADGTQDSGFDFSISLPITSTVLLGIRDGGDAVFLAGGDGRLYALDSAAMAQPTNWPIVLSGFLSASPALNGTDGTVYTSSLTGFFSGVCPNGISRFGFSTLGIQSSPAVGPDETVYFGADDAQLRAAQPDGPIKWAFSGSAPILGAPVVEADNGVTVAIYVADRGGLIFKVDANGRPFSGADGFDFAARNGGPVGPILSSPALAGDHLYVGSDDGNLYAIRTDKGRIDWSFPTGAAIVSSPAVATGGAQPVVVVGSNDGNVYFIRDEGTTGAAIETFSIGAPVRSSPAIGSDGTIYVGADDGRLYAIR